MFVCHKIGIVPLCLSETCSKICQPPCTRAYLAKFGPSGLEAVLPGLLCVFKDCTWNRNRVHLRRCERRAATK